jgi:hypothetical protein
MLRRRQRSKTTTQSAATSPAMRAQCVVPPSRSATSKRYRYRRRSSASNSCVGLFESELSFFPLFLSTNSNATVPTPHVQVRSIETVLIRRQRKPIFCDVCSAQRTRSSRRRSHVATRQASAISYAILLFERRNSIDENDEFRFQRALPSYRHRSGAAVHGHECAVCRRGLQAEHRRLSQRFVTGKDRDRKSERDREIESERERDCVAF